MGAEKEKDDVSQELIKETPVCLNCFQPVDPLFHYCPNCGRAVGQMTPVLPYEGLWWQADVWGKIWRQLWSKETSVSGKIIRLFMIVWFAPVLLIGLIWKLWKKKEARYDKSTELRSRLFSKGKPEAYGPGNDTHGPAAP